MTKRRSTFEKSTATLELEAQIKRLQTEAKAQRERDRRRASRRPALHRAAFEHLLTEAQARADGEHADRSLLELLNSALEAVEVKVNAEADKRAGRARAARVAAKEGSQRSDAGGAGDDIPASEGHG